MGWAYEGFVEEVEEVEQEETDGTSWAVPVRITISTGRTPTTYDAGFQYDSGNPYS